MSKWPFIVFFVLVLVAGCLALMWPNDTSIKSIDKDKIAVVVVDPWADAPWSLTGRWTGNKDHRDTWIKWWTTDVQNHMEEVLAPFVDYCRKKDITVIFSAQGHLVAEPFNHLEYIEPDISRTKDLNIYLRAKGINTIFYTGYSANLCVMDRPTGIRKMVEEGFNVVLIEDATLPVPEYSFTLEEVKDEVKLYRDVITIDEFKELIGG